MKKNLTFLGTLILSSFSFGQVGINTKDPKATMDITASASDLSVTDGLIAPRLTADQLRAKDNLYTIAQDGAIVYINTLFTGATSDKTTNINSIGYYYFDKNQGTVGRWMKIATPSAYQEPWYDVSTNQGATSNTQNIYLMGNVGIGINKPLSRFHIGGEIDPVFTIRGNSNNGNIDEAQGGIDFFEANSDKWGMKLKFYSPKTSGSIWGSNSNLLAFQGNLNGVTENVMVIRSKSSSDANNKGLVGINTDQPTQPLDVDGSTRLRGQIYDNNNVAGLSGQVLSTNTQGKVVWLNNIAITPARAAVFPRVNGALTSLTAETRLGTTLTLPAGKWSVNVTLLLMKEGDALLSGQSIWVRLTFSDDTSGTSNSADIIGSRYASGSLIGPMTFGLINGTIIINNTSGEDKTYYLTKNQQSPYKWGVGVDDNLQLRNLGSGFQSEDQIVAYPMN